MKVIAWLLAIVLLTPSALSLALSFTTSRFLDFTGEWTLHWYRELFSDTPWRRALANSVLIGTLTAVVSTATATAAAIALRRTRLGGGIEQFLLMPLYVPGFVIAVGLLAFFRAGGLWGTHAGMVIAHSVVVFPVALLVVRASLDRLNPDMEAAARGLGAGAWQSFRHVTWPLITPGVAAAALFAFVISLNETILALFLGTRDTTTVPRLIWPQLRFAVTPLAAAASGILVLITLPVVLLAARQMRFTIEPWNNPRDETSSAQPPPPP